MLPTSLLSALITQAEPAAKTVNWSEALTFFGVGLTGVFVVLGFLMGVLSLNALVVKKIEAKPAKESEKKA